MSFVWGDDGDRRKRRRPLRTDTPHHHGDVGDGDRRASNAASSCCGVSRVAGGDPGARGLHDHDCFRGEDRRLWHCTEILGSESCEMMPDEGAERTEAQRRRAERRRIDKRELPPPLQWLEAPGRRMMRSERRDGRLILTEVRAEHAELLREDGRLRMHLVWPEEDTAAAAAAAEQEERCDRKRETVLRRCKRAATGGRGESSRWCDPFFVTVAMAKV